MCFIVNRNKKFPGLSPVPGKLKYNCPSITSAFDGSKKSMSQLLVEDIIVLAFFFRVTSTPLYLDDNGDDDGDELIS